MHTSVHWRLPADIDRMAGENRMGVRWVVWGWEEVAEWGGKKVKADWVHERVGFKGVGSTPFLGLICLHKSTQTCASVITAANDQVGLQVGRTFVGAGK